MESFVIAGKAKVIWALLDLKEKQEEAARSLRQAIATQEIRNENKGAITDEKENLDFHGTDSAA